MEPGLTPSREVHRCQSFQRSLSCDHPTSSKFQGGPIPLMGQFVTTEKRRDGLSGCRKRLSKQGELQERSGTERQEEALTTRRERTLGTAECATFKTRKWEGSRRLGSRVQVPTSSRYRSIEGLPSRGRDQCSWEPVRASPARKSRQREQRQG